MIFKKYIPFDIVISKDGKDLKYLKWVKGIGYILLDRIFFEAYKRRKK